MNAAKLAKKYGNALIGRLVQTQSCGEWKACVAVVVQMEPDSAAPEIVFNVCTPGQGEIGVFEYEDLTLLPQPRNADASDVLLRVLGWLRHEVRNVGGFL